MLGKHFQTLTLRMKTWNLFIIYLANLPLCSVYPLSDYVNIQIAYRDFKKVEGTYLKAEIIL